MTLEHLLLAFVVGFTTAWLMLIAWEVVTQPGDEDL